MDRRGNEVGKTWPSRVPRGDVKRKGCGLDPRLLSAPTSTRGSYDTCLVPFCSVMSGPLNTLLTLQPPSSGLAVPSTQFTFWFFLSAGGNLPVCSREGTGHLTALPSTDVTSQVLFLQLLLLSDLCPLGKGWSVPALDGTYRLDWVTYRDLERQGRWETQPKPCHGGEEDQRG